MGSAINSFENLAHGNSTNWSIEALIKIANTCDTTYVYKTITPPAPSPCRSYEIIKTKKNEYNAFKIIDPCSKTTFNKESEKLKDIEITKAELYDIYGMKVKSFKINSFETFNLKKGIYIFKVQITNEIVTQKIIVE